MINSPEQLLKNIQKRMGELGMEDYGALAKAAGMKPPQLSVYVTENPEQRQVPSLKVIDRLAAALRTTPARLLAAPSEVIEHEIPECVRRVSRAALGETTPQPKSSAPASEAPKVPPPAAAPASSQIEELLKLPVLERIVYTALLDPAFRARVKEEIQSIENSSQKTERA